MKTISVHNAIGTMLCHDITRIIPGGEKGPVFSKGHIVRAEDIPVLLSVGKENLYVYEPKPGELHENDAAARLAVVLAGADPAAANLRTTEPREGRIDFVSTRQGLLHIDVDKLSAINEQGEICAATLHSLQQVEEGQTVAGVRVVPLVIHEEAILKAEAEVCTAGAPIIRVLPFKPFKVGMVTTGSEIFHGRIEDKFGPVLRRKFAALGCTVIGQTFTTDEEAMTSEAIRHFLDAGADMIVATGGMSVDPDDRTPAAIKASGAVIESYGSPTFPGAMFLLAYSGNVPILGLPGCVMYYKASIFDIVIPRLLAGIRVTRRHIAKLGHGGLCTGCEECRFPCCAFGKGA